ncbi:hypothetical protein K7X08_037522 [Anisodus acutangulus]|uniref:Uncharacterized protein n=1 Tax=Anisodus acutangulus TaxID=402998 RepID=A0A9Q1MXC1_9SOLA|nr:hypothetical protein K7X08_037522 [Anisodus acutangulus]
MAVVAMPIKKMTKIHCWVPPPFSRHELATLATETSNIAWSESGLLFVSQRETHQLRNLTEVWIHQTLQSLSMLSSSACTSTDDQQIVVKGNPPGPLTTFVEVIGIADSNQSIRAEIWSNFGDTIDTYSYNRICLLANGDYKHLFI